MPDLDFDVTISLRVTDRSALYRAALAVARREGMTRAGWRQLRNDPSHPTPTHADLQMLLDPGGLSGVGSAAGLKIFQTTATQPDGEDEDPWGWGWSLEEGDKVMHGDRIATVQGQAEESKHGRDFSPVVPVSYDDEDTPGEAPMVYLPDVADLSPIEAED